MAKALRPPGHTVSQQVATMEQAAATIPDCPLDLTDIEYEAYCAIIRSREISTWSEAELWTCGHLARATCRLDEVHRILAEEGYTVTNERGTQTAHPLLSASATQAQLVKALSQALGLTAPARGLTGPNQNGRNQAERKARQVLDKASKADGLLA